MNSNYPSHLLYNKIHELQHELAELKGKIANKIKYLDDERPYPYTQEIIDILREFLADELHE